MNGVIIVLGGWVICGFLAMAIADARGGSGAAGFFVGLVLGPLGLVVALFLGSAEGRAEKELAQGARRQCPECAELVRAEALVCRFCGHRFSGAVITD